MLFLTLYCVFKSVKQLSFDSPAETAVVKGSPTSAKVLRPPMTRIEPETSRTVSTRSTHSATETSLSLSLTHMHAFTNLQTYTHAYAN